MQPNEQSEMQAHTATELPEEKVVTSFENGRMVARVFGYEEMVDNLSVAAVEAKKATAIWDERKPLLRVMARRVINSIASAAISVRAVLFHGTDQNVVEVAPSTTCKTLSQDLVNEVKFRKVEHLIQQKVEVVLTGSLARWAIANLPIMCKPDILESNMKVNKRFILTDTFLELYKAVMHAKDCSEDCKDFFQRLCDGGYNLPAVEAKK